MQPEVIRNTAGERLEFSFHSGDPGRSVVLVLGHGVTGNKDRPLLMALAEGAAAAGIPTLRFSFAGNGSSEGAFGAATVSKEADDLRAVVDAVQAAAGSDIRIVYGGHSMGGAVGLLHATRDPRIAGLVSLAGMVHVWEFAQRKFGELTPGTDCMWEKPECPLSLEYMADMERLGTLEPLAAEVRVPWLLVHGVGDTVVPVQDSRDAVARSSGRGELVELPDADHVFSGDGAQDMVAAVVPWLRENFPG